MPSPPPFVTDGLRIESPDLSSRRFKANPYPFYARLRAEAPVYRMKLGFWLPRAWIVTRYADVLALLKDDRFSNDVTAKLPWVPRTTRPLTQHMLNRDPPDHTRLRTLVNKAFTPRVVDGMRGRIQSVCDGLLDAAAARGRMELVADLALALPLRVIADLLGVPARDRHRFAGWSKRVAAATSGALLDLVRGQPSLFRAVWYLRRVVALRRAEPADDLVTALIRAEEAGDRLDEDEVVGMIALLLLAGYETTINLIASGTLALVQNPEERARFQAEPDHAEPAVEELLRYTSPADFASFRVAREDVAIAGTVVPRGGMALAALTAANRDERQFPDPDRLDLGREPNRHLAFGIGAHFCVGAPLARLEGRIALTTLFRRFPGLSLGAPPEKLRWRRGLLFRGLEELPIVLGT
jgi:cytochrome P450 PksS